MTSQHKANPTAHPTANPTMATITLNGKEIRAPEGANLLQVAKDSGVHIAHYCYHEGLPVAGVCRLCMVEVDGSPRPQPSCNMTVRDGMSVVSNSEKIKEIVSWGLQYHLINHPLDCPICDQAGECILQDSYMEYGIYDSNMTEPKVHKKKVVDLGPKIVLDKERCILCARCTRFTSDVTKTHELGIFNRGDHSEVGTYKDIPFDNTYSINTVDICPVGALTSKDFRFQQRVWFTLKYPSMCIKCSTGCNITVSSNQHGTYRVTPAKNMNVNTWWMCDQGRDVYKWLNIENRYSSALSRVRDNGGGNKLVPIPLAQAIKKFLHDLPAQRDFAQTTWLISPQHTVEEYTALYSYFKSKLIPDKNIFLWYENTDHLNDFDGLLLRGNKSPNSKGLKAVAEKHGYTFDPQKFEKSFSKTKHTRVVILGPENIDAHPGIYAVLTELRGVIWLGGVRLPDESLEAACDLILPTKVFSEKSGTYINATGISQTIKAFQRAAANTVDIKDLFSEAVTESRTLTGA